VFVQPRLIFVRPELKEKLLALTTNIKLGWKCLQGLALQVLHSRVSSWLYPQTLDQARKPSQTNLIFVSKAGAYPRGAPFGSFTVE